MSKVDWSLAPKWAEYVVVGPLSGFNYWANDDRRIQFCGDFDCRNDNHVKEGWDVVEHKSEPKAWSGPEDGLPPVNERVEVLWSSITGEYVDALILAHDGDRAVFRFVTGDRKGEYQADKLHFSGKFPNFRAIKTQKQIADEKRESAIREFMDVVGIDCRVTASKAVDAGFKREVV